jgi:hypothetical protein
LGQGFFVQFMLHLPVIPAPSTRHSRESGNLLGRGDPKKDFPLSRE